MAGIDKRLTDLTEITTPSDDAFIHVVEPTDISQNPAGSSYKVKKLNFGGLSDAPSDGNQYARKNAAWEVVSSGVLTTNTNITSSSLTTQDVAGFVSYINGLVSSFAVATNEIRTYTVTDTGQKFELLLRGRSFGFTEPPIISSDVLEICPVLLTQISITTSVSITTATLSSNGIAQFGKHVLIKNGVNNINITVNGVDSLPTTYQKEGTGTITFVQGSGRTLRQVDGTAVLNGAVGSTASLSTDGTTDSLRISNG